MSPLKYLKLKYMLKPLPPLRRLRQHPLSQHRLNPVKKPRMRPRLSQNWWLKRHKHRTRSCSRRGVVDRQHIRRGVIDHALGGVAGRSEPTDWREDPCTPLGRDQSRPYECVSARPTLRKANQLMECIYVKHPDTKKVGRGHCTSGWYLSKIL